MVHGGPDFGLYTPKTTVISIEDLGELAARLGSIVNFDRKGDVLWFDDFEEGIDKWVKVLTGDRGSVEWSAAYPYTKGFSALLTTGTTDEDLIGITRYFAAPVLSKIGFEITFTIDENVLEASFIIYLDDGTNIHMARIFYVQASKTWQYYDSEGDPQDLSPTIYLARGGHRPNTLKLVVDFTTGYYSHLKVNDTTFDLSTYQYRKTTGGSYKHCYFYFKIQNNAAVEATSYIDNAVVTQNEP